MKEIRIERALDWLATALTANRTENPILESYWSAILPTVEIFGSQRASEMQVATVAGDLGAIEVFHSQVVAGRVRHYLSVSYSSNDSTPRKLMPGRIIPTAAGFPFAAFRDQIEPIPGEELAVRNVTVGPLQRIAVQSNAMAGAARMTLKVVWVEFPLGESVKLV